MTELDMLALKEAKFWFEEKVHNWKGREIVFLGPVHVEVNGKKYVQLVMTRYYKTEPWERGYAVANIEHAASDFLKKTDFSYDPHDWHNFCSISDYNGGTADA